jgi:hypothetical protein
MCPRDSTIPRHICYTNRCPIVDWCFTHFQYICVSLVLVSLLHRFYKHTRPHFPTIVWHIFYKDVCPHDSTIVWHILYKVVCPYLSIIVWHVHVFYTDMLISLLLIHRFPCILRDLSTISRRRHGVQCDLILNREYLKCNERNRRNVARCHDIQGNTTRCSEMQVHATKQQMCRNAVEWKEMQRNAETQNQHEI